MRNPSYLSSQCVQRDQVFKQLFFRNVKEVQGSMNHDEARRCVLFSDVPYIAHISLMVENRQQQPSLKTPNLF